ncbi:MAG: SDR family oxidoreductase [Treponemataceae bacterium]
MRVLFIGGTGNISTACTHRALERNMEVFHLNRGNRPEKIPAGVRSLNADIRKPEEVRRALSNHRFDSVVQFLGYRPEHIEADVGLFEGVTEQYVFLSSASAYRRPSRFPIITESTPLANPYWEYSRLKIACEETLIRLGKEKDFPYTIIRPSHTYDDGWIPSCFGSADFGIAWRMLAGKEIVVPGDGQSLWTLTHASDFAKGLVGLLGNPSALGEAFHITSDEALTWDTIHSTIGAAFGVTPKLVHIPSDYIARIAPERAAGLLGDKATSAIFDNSKIRRFVPDFRPAIGFSEGIRRSAAWYDEHPQLKVPNAAVNEELDRILGYWAKAVALTERANA